ncbi:protein toll-like [Cydia amplana]|uniref:protein toll-like n=1 Tax=Cydia amplana TaxID=1869771 RepID=UPI002FE6086A
MKAFALLFALGCARAELMPKCIYSSCVTRDSRDTDDGWLLKEYLLEGAHMSIATRSGHYAVRWSCGGLNPAGYLAPRFSKPYVAYEVELVDCNVPLDSSYTDLFKSLNINSKYAKSLTINLSTTQPQISQWFSTDNLQKIKNKYQARSNNWLTAAADDLPKNSLEHLTLCGIPMTTDQFISIHNIISLTLIETGLEEVMDLEEFSKLTRLELRDPYLLNAEKLNTTSIEELVLYAPDAGLAAMPHVRNATFIEVYVMGRLFGNCSNLKHLALIDGTLSVLPDHWLVGCSALKSLKITQLRNLMQIPGDLLADTTELRSLDLSHNSLETLPEGLLDNTRSLEYLDISDNHLKSLPAKLPVSLKKLYACGNYHHFPLAYQNLKFLEEGGCI